MTSHSHHSRRHGALAPARLSTLLIALGAVALAPSRLAAQQPHDSARTRADSARTLEGVTVSAIRANNDAPIARSTLHKADIEERFHGQDIPQLLQGTPSLTLKSETGTPWGYSYIRLRGMEHRRINFTLDGIPLNDPEDHVLYFADFPDLGNSLHSVQVQRGVGTSSTGVAAYAGSVNMESIALATTPRSLEAQAQAGAFASRRLSVEYASGLVDRTAVYARASALRTNGYRHHAGVDARSVFVSGAYFGERDVVKLIATAGLFADTMAYVGASEAELRADRRFNPLRPDETDRFVEQVLGLTYVRSLAAASSWSSTLYRVAADGAYRVCIDRCDQAAADLWSFDLDFAWYGITSAWNYARDRARVSVGANANTYARDHSAFALPNNTTPLYLNTGHKRDASAFVKVAYDLWNGRGTLFGDVQGRLARFRYVPDAQAGIAGSARHWGFLNPKVGATYRLNGTVTLFGSYGVNSREPSREDMFGGFDNLDTTNVGFVGSLDRVAPERASDLEAGITWASRPATVTLNGFDMRFRNEILPIGELSYIGTPLRKNVPTSYRRGLEADVAVRPWQALEASVNATVMTSRIREYTNRDGRVYRDVPALLTPAFQTAHRLRFMPGHRLELTLEGRYAAESHLTNTGDRTLMLPGAYVVDGAVTWRMGAYALSLFGSNLGNSRAYSTGNVSSSGTARYFVLAPPSVQAMVRATF